MLNDSLIPQSVPAGKPLTLFQETFTHGWFHRLWAKLTRRCFCLLDLDQTLEISPVESSSYAGLKTVRIDRIQGTQGKVDEFDAEFNPTQERSRSRWMGVALEKLRGRDLPPVDLVQVGEVYYVRDGHHRISVSRAMGQSFIDAEVTILRLHEQSKY
jgi:hypothetical protein